MVDILVIGIIWYHWYEVAEGSGPHLIGQASASTHCLCCTPAVRERSGIYPSRLLLIWHWTSAVLQVVARELFELRADLEAISSRLESTTDKLEPEAKPAKPMSPSRPFPLLVKCAPVRSSTRLGAAKVGVPFWKASAVLTECPCLEFYRTASTRSEFV